MALKFYFIILFFIGTTLSLPVYSDLEETPPITSEEILEEIGLVHGYFAFYKTGPTEFLGNFAYCPNGIDYEGHHFQNSEAAFQWKKFQLAAGHNNNDEMRNDPEIEAFFEASGEEAFALRQKLDKKNKGIFPVDWKKG